MAAGLTLTQLTDTSNFSVSRWLIMGFVRLQNCELTSILKIPYLYLYFYPYVYLYLELTGSVYIVYNIHIMYM